MRDKHTGKIERWFGTYTDIHDAVMARLEARRTRQQLLSVISHAQVTLWAVDRHRNLTLLEGAFMLGLGDSTDAGDDARSVGSRGSGKGLKSDQYVGQNIYKVFAQHNPSYDGNPIPPSLAPIEGILTGRIMEEVFESYVENKWYRTRFVPVLGKKTDGGAVNEAFIDGVIGVSMDGTLVRCAT